MTDHIILPRAVFESPDYLLLSKAERLLLIDLYAHFGDCETFTFYRDDPNNRCKRLVDKGFLEIAGQHYKTQNDGKSGRGVRLFRFVHSVTEAYG